MSKITFEIKEQIVSLSSSRGWQKELNLISWNGYEPKYDIREWDSTHTNMGKGITLSRAELLELYSALKGIFEEQKDDDSQNQLNIEEELKKFAEMAPAFFQELKNITLYMNENGLPEELQRDLLMNNAPEFTNEALRNEIETMSIVYGKVYTQFITILEKLTSSSLSLFFDLMINQRREHTLENKQNVNTEVLYCRGKDSNGSGSYSQNGELTVYKGSVCHLVEAATAEAVAVKRKELLDTGVLIKKENLLEFTQDYTFLSPSAAASVVLARRANGWTEWKDKNGVTLDVLVRR